ncbi:MAG: hypothetical protein ACI4EB_04205, partial [Bilifractor sp.]
MATAPSIFSVDFSLSALMLPLFYMALSSLLCACFVCLSLWHVHISLCGRYIARKTDVISMPSLLKCSAQAERTEKNAEKAGGSSVSGRNQEMVKDVCGNPVILLVTMIVYR